MYMYMRSMCMIDILRAFRMCKIGVGIIGFTECHP